MYARVITAELDEEDLEKFGGMIRDLIMPRVQTLPGFVGGYWLVDRDNRKGLGITLFESQAALEASEEQANRIREEGIRAGLPVSTFEHYEVIGSALKPEKKAA